MRFDVLSLFPDALSSWMEFSILKRAQAKGLVEVRLVDIRSFAADRHRTADDQPYGCGVGMLMKPDVVIAAIESCLDSRDVEGRGGRVLLMTPSGRKLDQPFLEELAREDHLVLVCGRYEGIDDRVRSGWVTDEVSVGDFVLTGGELPAAVIVDGVTRLIPGVLGKDESSAEESFTSGMLEYPQYTRPPVFRGLQAPAILQGGNHLEVKKWRERQAIFRTLANRPDLLPLDWRDRLNPPRKVKRKKRPQAS